MQGHLKKFKEEIQELGNKILQAALALHERVSSTFRKTAVNFHYEVSIALHGIVTYLSLSGLGNCVHLLYLVVQIVAAAAAAAPVTCCNTCVWFCAQFTVRHLANVFQGLLMGLPEVVNT
jgi:hypothetical protein